MTRSRAVWSLQIMPVLKAASACFSFFFSFVSFFYETCTLFFHENGTHQSVPLLISQSGYMIWKKKFDAYRKSSHQSSFYFSNHLFVYGNIKVKTIFNLTNRPLITSNNSIQIYIKRYNVNYFFVCANINHVKNLFPKIFVSLKKFS